MILHENIKALKSEFTGIDWEPMLSFGDKQQHSNTHVEESKSGLPTLVIEREGRTQYIHSKYNPIEEAERIAEQFEGIGNGKHVLFFGIGLGYVIKAIVKKYPDITFSIYEPDPDIFYNFISHIPLNSFPFSKLHNIFINNYFADEELLRYDFFKRASNNTIFVYLPIYQQLFKNEYDQFTQEFIKSIKSKGFDIRTRYLFERQWMANYVGNLKHIIREDNILHLDKKYFRGKPAILVSAGPSLEEEIGNLKYIKENGLAYIFSVGSAIKALLRNDICPDGICAIDGTAGNYEIYERQIKDVNNKIPLIYASSFFCKAATEYKGSKFHAFTSDDAIADYYLRYSDGSNIEKIGVAPTVAITTLEILFRMEFDPVILVGQNFAYKYDNYYSTSIEGYENRSTSMTEADKTEAFKVEDVYGGTVFTCHSLDIMRRQMELLVARLDMENVINTTAGGAQIRGTSFEALASVIQKRLKNSIVTNDWVYSTAEVYDYSYVRKQQELMKEELKGFEYTLDEFTGLVDKLKKADYKKKDKTINNLFNNFAKTFSALIRNKFYEVYLIKISSVELDVLLKHLEIVAAEKDLVKRANSVGVEFECFIDECRANMIFLSPIFKEIDNTIQEFAKETETLE